MRAEIVKDVLLGRDITALIVNKRDSSYNTFGYFEVVVHNDNVIEALRIIEDEIVFE
ncbi:MAG TPA: hypothetical protein VGA21_07840 [Cyclobacteriaceae bacterium]